MRDQFDSNSLFQRAMKEAFEEFVNKDVGKHTNADLLAQYVDEHLYNIQCVARNMYTET